MLASSRSLLVFGCPNSSDFSSGTEPQEDEMQIKMQVEKQILTQQALWIKEKDLKKQAMG